ncbi:hypothetical protein JTE90_011765 [Oedothorax gibbosus]|uniref:Uncharacterized protein n=1 Tax=Oedothorax gibbosus TaxID=931172 RepID=A0AAV6VRL3_9ARAC|nr:hypothetical protein JTE90_011765 [Oedothorax gibbosus]
MLKIFNFVFVNKSWVPSCKLPSSRNLRVARKVDTQEEEESEMRVVGKRKRPKEGSTDDTAWESSPLPTSIH